MAGLDPAISLRRAQGPRLIGTTGTSPVVTEGKDAMSFDVNIRACWDDDAKVSTATSSEIEGLVIEAEALPEVFREIALVLPDLLEAKSLC
jgi:hypothetical protein